MAERSVRWRVFAAAALGVALPFGVTTFPPITDLPQHLSQVRLLFEALGAEPSAYLIQWFTPYATAYGVLAALWLVMSPLWAGKLGTLLIAVLSLGATHLLARRFQRPPEAVLVASLFGLNHILYWGFLSFALGWPVFVLWMLLAGAQTERFHLREALVTVLAAALLFVTHALWFGAGVGWLLVDSALRRPSPRVLVGRALSVLPVGVGAALWYPTLAQRGFDTPPLWVTTPFDRIAFPWWVDSALGGLRGGTESWVFLAVLVWLSMGLWQSRATLRSTLEPVLLATAGCFLGAAWLLPDKFENTIRFSSRWAPFGLALLVLALPTPRFSPRTLRVAAGGLFAAFVLATTLAWLSFERTELSGLEEAVAAVPEGKRVLGLDYLRESELIRGRPFLQMFAYAQALKGAELNFSFADFAPSLVVYKEIGARRQWTNGLEWYPERVKERDFQHFDFALVSGKDEIHQRLTRTSFLRPVTAGGVWRLYAVQPVGVR